MARINHADFATVQIKNGFPHFGYDLGHGNTSTMIPYKINDGLWHKVGVHSEQFSHAQNNHHKTTKISLQQYLRPKINQ